MPTIKIKTTNSAYLGLINAFKHLELEDLPVSFCFSVAKNAKLSIKAETEFQDLVKDINTKEYAEYEDKVKALAENDTAAKDVLDAEYKVVIADRSDSVAKADAWLAKEVEVEVFAFELNSIPESLDRKIVMSMVDWIA